MSDLLRCILRLCTEWHVLPLLGYTSYMTIRAVVGARVSAMGGDDKLSHVDQRETGIRYAERQGWQVVGTFEDLDVSAIDKTPWERPGLREWLRRSHEWDALVFTKTDRAFRSARDAMNLAGWCEDNRKILAFSDDGIEVDYYSPADQKDPFSRTMAEIFLTMASMFAQIEGRRFKSRAESRVRSLRNTDRWGYGIPPYGYRVIDHPSGKGKALDLDPETQETLHERLAKPLLEGTSLTRIAHDLAEAEIPSPRDAIRLRRGDAARGDKWMASKIHRILESPATMGIKMASGKPLLDAEGQPVKVGPPSFDRDTWEQIQKTLARRSQEPRNRVHSTNPLLGVAKCGSCGKNLRQRSQTTPKGVTHRYYVCGTAPRPCPKISIIADDAEEILKQQFLSELGDLKVRRLEFSPGEDVSYELDDINARIEDLREDRQAGLFRDEEDQRVYREQMKSLLNRRDELKQRPYRPAGWITVEEDYTYAEAWESSSTEERRKLLTDSGIQLTLLGQNVTELHIPQNILERDFPGYEDKAPNIRIEEGKAYDAKTGEEITYDEGDL